LPENYFTEDFTLNATLHSRHGRLFAGLFAGLAALAVTTACSFSASTAHISDLKVGTSKDMTTQATTFGKTDTIYAMAHVANAPFKTTLTWHLICVKVAGQPPNATITQLDKSFDLDNDGDVSINYSAPTAGWPSGTYKIDAVLMEDGNKRDEKTAEITIQ
jgi:hypothetical protein